MGGNKKTSDASAVAETRCRALETQLANACELAHFGTWEVDLADGTIQWSPNACRILGLAAQGGIGVWPDTLLERVHPDDRRRIASSIGRSCGGSGGERVEYRVVHPDRSVHYLDCRATVTIGADGHPRFLYGVVKDITEIRQVEQELARNEARFRTLVESTGDWIWEVGPDARYTYVSPKVQDLLGYAPGQILGKTPFDFMPEQEAQRVAALFGPLVEARRPFDGLVNTNRRKDGGLVFLETSGVPFFDAEGSFAGYRGIDRDITERVRMEERLRNSERRFRELAEHIREVFWLVSPDWDKVHYISPAYEEVWGRSCESLYRHPRSWLEALHPDDRERLAATLQVLDPAEVALVDFPEYRVCRPDGTERWIKARGYPVRDAAGEIVRVAGMAEDITQRKQAELALSATTERHRLVLEHAADAVLVSDPQARLVYANQRASLLLGYDVDVLCTMSIQHIVPPAALERSLALFQQLGVEGHLRTEVELMHRDGRTIATEINAVGLPDGSFYAAFRDITERLRLEAELDDHRLHLEQLVDERTAELEQARLEAERLTRVKSEFLANMSHEIRTPMNAIMGLAHLLRGMALPSEAAELAGKIDHAGRSLQIIINDILDFSKLEAGRLEIETAPFEISGVLDNLAAILSAGLGDKPIELTIIPPPPEGNRVRGDALRLEQVLINLGSNAIKFTETGQVVIQVELLAVDAAGVHLRFGTRDTGIGIPPAQRQEIFAPFSQADGSTSRRFGGTGLGLSISRQLVSLMGGELALESEEGRGSEFSFVLTLEPAPETARPVRRDLAELDLLIADDSEIAREALRRTAELLGWRVSLVESGEAVLEKIGGGQGADVLLLDWQMPGLDGLATARRIHDAVGEARAPVVILVTGHDRARLLAQPDAGLADAVLEKPVTASSLYDSVARAQRIRRGEPDIASPGPVARRRLAGLRILVVDDSDINREVAQRIFSGEGASVTLAGDGQQALKCMEGGKEAFDIVLMDVQMPVLDGLAATRTIRATPALAGLPVVALSAGAFKEQQARAEAAGMDGFIPKPIDVNAAVGLIRRLTGRSQAPPAPARVSQGDAGFPGIDIGRGLDNWGNAAAYGQFLRKFVQDYGGIVWEIVTLSPDRAAARLHKLKGAAGSLALPEVNVLAQELERRLEGGEAAGELPALLQQALEQAIESIGRYAPTTESPSALLDRDRAAPLLGRAQQALEEDDLDAVGALLHELATCLPTEHLEPLRRALEEFSVTRAQQVLKAVAEELDIPLRSGG